MLELEDSAELTRLKREAAVRAREEECERKRLEDLKAKRERLQGLKAEHEAQEALKAKERLTYIRRQAQLRAEKKAELQRLDDRREAQIAKRHSAWLAKANKAIQQTLQAHAAEEDRLERAVQDARDRKHAKAKAVADVKAQKKAQREELDMRRSEAMDQRSQARELKGLQRVEELKSEAFEELMNFIHHPQPVPLKQTLVGRVRPVPRVTELLAAYKDGREDLEDLEQQDIPMRATLRNLSIFQYVKEIQQKAEAERIRPPEPAANDANRGMRGSSSRRTGQGSPSRSPSRKITSPLRRQK